MQPFLLSSPPAEGLEGVLERPGRKMERPGVLERPGEASPGGSWRGLGWRGAGGGPGEGLEGVLERPGVLEGLERPTEGLEGVLIGAIACCQARSAPLRLVVPQLAARQKVGGYDLGQIWARS